MPDTFDFNKSYPRHVLNALDEVCEKYALGLMRLNVLDENDEDDTSQYNATATSRPQGIEQYMDVFCLPLKEAEDDKAASRMDVDTASTTVPAASPLQGTWLHSLTNGSSTVLVCREYIQHRITRKDVPYHLSVQDVAFASSYKVIRTCAMMSASYPSACTNYDDMKLGREHVRLLAWIHGYLINSVLFLHDECEKLGDQLCTPELLNSGSIQRGNSPARNERLPVYVRLPTDKRPMKNKEKHEKPRIAKDEKNSRVNVVEHAARLSASFITQLSRILEDTKLRSAILMVTNALMNSRYIYDTVDASSKTWAGACSSFTLFMVQASSLVEKGIISLRDYQRMIRECATIIVCAAVMPRPMAAAVNLEIMVERFCGDLPTEADVALQYDMLAHLKQVLQIFVYRADKPYSTKDDEDEKLEYYQRLLQLLNNSCGHPSCDDDLTLDPETRPQAGVTKAQLDAELSRKIMTFSSDHQRTYCSALNDCLGLPPRWCRGPSCSCPSEFTFGDFLRVSAPCLAIATLWGTPKHRRCRNGREKATLQHLRQLTVFRQQNPLNQQVYNLEPELRRVALIQKYFVNHVSTQS